MGGKKWRTLIKILLFLGFGTLFFSLFIFQNGQNDILKRSFLYMVGCILIFLYIKLFINIIKGYFLRATEQLYHNWKSANARFDLRLFRVIVAIAAPLIMVLFLWIVGKWFWHG